MKFFCGDSSSCVLTSTGSGAAVEGLIVVEEGAVSEVVGMVPMIAEEEGAEAEWMTEVTDPAIAHEAPPMDTETHGDPLGKGAETIAVAGGNTFICVWETHCMFIVLPYMLLRIVSCW